MTRRPSSAPEVITNLKKQWLVYDRTEIACTVEWTEVPRATSYQLRAPGSVNNTLLYDGPLTKVVGRRSSAAYCASEVQVRACNAAGCTAWSSPPTPQNVVTYGTPGGGVEL